LLCHATKRPSEAKNIVFATLQLEVEKNVSRRHFYEKKRMGDEKLITALHHILVLQDIRCKEYKDMGIKRSA
jgi:hypothetical protein